jgi:hypothetical protein
MNRLHRHRPRGPPGDPECGKPPLALSPLGLVDRRHVDVARIDPLGEIPESLSPDPAGDRDLAAHHQELQHLRHVATVRPPARHPRDDGRVRDVAGAQRPRAGEQVEDVAAKAVVLAQPRARSFVARPFRSACEVEAEVAHGAHERIELEQGAVLLQRLLELLRPVGRAETTPRDEVGARRNGRRRIDLQQGQPLHHIDEGARAPRVEQLRPHCDAPRLRLRQPMHGSGG